jgi:hypothetical protein
MHWRFFLYSELVIKRLERSDANKLRRDSTVLASEASGTVNEETEDERKIVLRKKGSGCDDQSNQIHMMTARSQVGISNEGLQM